MSNKISDAIRKAKESVDATAGLSEEERKMAFQTVLAELLRTQDVSMPVPKEQPLIEQRTRKEDLESLYNRLLPNGHTQTILLIAYWTYTQSRSFITLDVIEGFKSLLLTVPQNPKDLINKLVMRGLLMLTGKDEQGRDKMQITRSGIQLVENGWGSGNDS